MNEEIEKINKRKQEFELKTQSLTKELVLKWCTKYGLLGFAHEEADKILFKPKFFPYEYGAIDKPMSMIEEINKNMGFVKEDEILQEKRLKDVDQYQFYQSSSDEFYINAEKTVALELYDQLELSYYKDEINFALFQPLMYYSGGNWLYSANLILVDDSFIGILKEKTEFYKKKAKLEKKTFVQFFEMLNSDKSINLFIKSKDNCYDPGFYQMRPRSNTLGKIKNKYVMDDFPLENFFVESNVRGDIKKQIRPPQQNFYKCIYMESYKQISRFAKDIYQFINIYTGKYLDDLEIINEGFKEKLKVMSKKRKAEILSQQKDILKLYSSNILQRTMPIVNFDSINNRDESDFSFYQSNSLISMIGVMIINDITNKRKKLKICNYINCSQPFYAFKESQKFCCSVHGDSARLQRFRNKQKLKIKEKN